jgi:hypothetical protein
MAYPLASRKQQFQSAPRAQSANGPPGQVVAITVSATPAVINLQTGVSQAAFNRQTGDDPKQVIRNYVTIECDVDLAIVFGPTLASVTTTNVPVIATVGTVNASGVYSPAAGTAFVIYAKLPTRVLLQDQVDLFMGFVASGAGTMRLYQSSADNA